MSHYYTNMLNVETNTGGGYQNKKDRTRLKTQIDVSTYSQDPHCLSANLWLILSSLKHPTYCEPGMLQHKIKILDVYKQVF